MNVNGPTVLGFGYSDGYDIRKLERSPKVWQGYNSRRGARRKRNRKGGKQ